MKQIHYNIEGDVLLEQKKMLINYLGVGGIASWQREVLLLRSIASETRNIKGNNHLHSAVGDLYMAYRAN